MSPSGQQIQPPRHPHAGPRHRSGIIAAVLLGCLFPGSSVGVADIIRLHNGNQIQGEIVRRDPNSVTVRFPGGILTIPQREIAGIKEESRIDYLLAEGEKHARRKDFEGALEYLATASEEFRGSQRVGRQLLDTCQEHARHLVESRYLEGAAAAFLKVLELDPENAAARSSLDQVRRRIEQARTEEARGIREIANGSASRGHERLKRLYEEFPERRPSLAPSIGIALIGMGNSALEGNEPGKAERHYLEAITFDPDLIGLMSAGYVHLKVRQLKPLFQLNQYERLLEEADRALEVVPASPLLNYFRGHALEGLGRWSDAAEIYLRITGKPRPANLEKSLAVLKRAVEESILGRRDSDGKKVPSVDEVLPGKWRTIRTDHFIVHHRNHRIGKEIAQVSEATYRRLFQEIGLRTHWYRPCEVFIYPTREDFLELSGEHDWMGGSHRVVTNTGSLWQHRIDTFQTQPRLAQAVIPHEVAHAMFVHRMRYRPSIPIWVNEGFAIWAEPSFVHRHYERLVAEAHQFDMLFDVTELVRLKDYPRRDNVRLFYAQCFSLCNLLIRQKGLGKFVDFVEELSLSPTSLGVLLNRHYRIAGVPALRHYWIGTLAR